MSRSEKPHWPDACCHDRPRDRFLGTVDVDDPVDVFVYQDNALDAAVPDMHVCLRYGAEDHQYMSPGSVSQFIENTKKYFPNTSEYAMALPLVEAWLNETKCRS